MMLVIHVESTADMLAVAQLVDKELTENDIARGLARKDSTMPGA